MGCKLGGQDELESLAYVLLYFLHGGLPWEGLVDSNLIAQQQLECSVKDLCDGLPIKYATLLSYSWMLPFNAKPDYDYLSRLFGGLITHPVFDWDSGLAHNHINTLYPPLQTIASRTCRP